jgi:hypothetical protein
VIQSRTLGMVDFFCFGVPPLRGSLAHRDKLAGSGTPTRSPIARLGSKRDRIFRFRQNYSLNVSYLYEAFKDLAFRTGALTARVIVDHLAPVCQGVRGKFSVQRRFSPFLDVCIFLATDETALAESRTRASGFILTGASPETVGWPGHCASLRQRSTPTVCVGHHPSTVPMPSVAGSAGLARFEPTIR